MSLYPDPAVSRKQTMSVRRWKAGDRPLDERDELVVEEPLEIRVRGRSVCVTMRTPEHDEELAAGFLLTEGVIGNAADVLRIEPCGRNADDNVLNVVLAPDISFNFDDLTRHVFASSSCGLCGKASIDSVHQHFPPLPSGDDLTIDATILADLPERMRQEQTTFDQTGGLHAAAVFDRTGAPIVVREDVGRHNAVDKVIGYGLLNDHLPFDAHVLMVSGRASFEIVQKSLAARIPIIAAVSAPSSLAVQFAQESGQTLVGFLRDRRMNAYTEAQRVHFGCHT